MKKLLFCIVLLTPACWTDPQENLQTIAGITGGASLIASVPLDMDGNDIQNAATVDIDDLTTETLVVGPITHTPTTSTTVADGAGTHAATSLAPVAASSYLIVCEDTDGCTVTLSEVGAVAGMQVTLVYSGANHSDFSDSAGVSELSAALAMDANDALVLFYSGSAWVEVSRSVN